jgi:hypothetical protein
MSIYPTPEERWGVLPFDEWKEATQVHELVHSSRVVTEPEKPVPSPAIDAETT